MKIWIDLSNSPHPLLFAPVAKRLEEIGHEVALTARDNAQTVELALQRWSRIEVIGGESPGGRAAKAASMGGRIRSLTSWARSERPELAISHNSYAQIVAARALGIPSVTAMDFEHQPVNHLAFRLARRVLLPAALASTDVRRQGAKPGKTFFYEGLKEELYLGDFVPDPDVLAHAGVGSERSGPLVVARTPPSRAIYHRFGNPLFIEALEAVAAQPDVRCVVLVRHPEQREAIVSMGLPGVTVPERAVDSRSLMHAADLVLGAGGTMTREAALIGVPTFSIFAGTTPAVDRWLEGRGALRRLERADELVPVRPRQTAPADVAALRRRGDHLADAFVSLALGAVTDRPVASEPAAAAA